MNSTYYSSLSGMLAASYGLQTTSNNIANMQSHGFKRSDVFYSSLGNGEDSSGSGVTINGSATNFNEGKYLQTDTMSDLAIVGNGFFIVRLKSNELIYTRNGQFSFKDGLLRDKNTDGLVQGYDKTGNLVPIHEKGPKTTAGNASRDIFLKGTFVARTIKNDTTTKDQPPNPNNSDPSSTTKMEMKYENIIFDIQNVYDAQGKAHTIKVELKNKEDSFNKINNWNIENITCGDAQITFPFSQELEFIEESGAEEGKSSFQFTLNGQTVTVYLGVFRNSESEIVNLKSLEKNPSATTDVSVWQNDGYGLGTQSGFSFDENGQIFYHYDNGKILSGSYIGLARFDDMEHNLIQTPNNFFRAKTNKGIHYGRPNHDGFSFIQPKQLETSNVDSTVEFANIVVLQRMFQACSQIMDIEKQLLEELEAKS